MSRDPSKSRPLSDNVKRMMWLERASPRNGDVYRSKRKFTESDHLYCHKQALLFMEAAAMGLKMESFAPLYMKSQLAGVVDHYFCSSFQDESSIAKLLQMPLLMDNPRIIIETLYWINPTEQKMIIRPCDEGARDAIRWCVMKADKRKSRQITCKIFAERLYEMMGWDPIYRYRLQGMKIRYNDEQMYLFDLKSHECFLPQKKDAATGKVKAATAEFPQDWQSSFGMKVDEHDMSTQVNFLDGYMSPNDTEKTGDYDEQDKTES